MEKNLNGEERKLKLIEVRRKKLKIYKEMKKEEKDEFKDAFPSN